MARRKENGSKPQEPVATGKTKRPSITAVARQAGVSIATVSRVINNQTQVQPELVRKVRQAIERVGYLPNGSARSLSSGRSRLFGVLISNLMNPFFPELLQMFEEKAVAIGYEVLVVSTAYDTERMTTCISRMLERKVDGVAVMTFGIEGPMLNRLTEHGVPLVFMDTAPEGPNMHRIQMDYDTGLRQAVQHLAVLGHRRLGFVLGPQQQTSIALRSEAIRRAVQQIGLAWNSELVFMGDHTLQSGEAALQAFLRLKRPPTAILCSNDVSAIGVMHAAQDASICIPEDLSLIGFDCIEFGAYMVPPLTSVMMSRREIAEAAVDVLWNSAEGRRIPDRQIATQLVVRRTTAVPKGSLDDLRSRAQ